MWQVVEIRTMSGPVCRRLGSRTEPGPVRQHDSGLQWSAAGAMNGGAYGKRQTGSDGVQERSTPVDVFSSYCLSRHVPRTYTVMALGGLDSRRKGGGSKEADNEHGDCHRVLTNHFVDCVFGELKKSFSRRRATTAGCSLSYCADVPFCACSGIAGQA